MAEPNNYAGSFPVTVKFKGKIAVAKPGVVKYRYEWGDGNIGKLKIIAFIKSEARNPKLRIKPKVYLKSKITVKKLADWRALAKAMMPDRVIQKFKSVGPAGYMGEVTWFEAEVANIGNLRSGKCELSITMYVPENAPKTEDNNNSTTFVVMHH